MTKFESATTHDRAPRQRERRTSLHGTIEKIQAHPETPVTFDETVNPEDAQKVERNALAAILIDRATSYSLSQRSQRPPYGLFGVVSDRNLTIERGQKFREDYDRADHNEAIRRAFMSTLNMDLNTTLADLEQQQDPVKRRLGQLMETHRDIGAFIRPGLETAMGMIELIVNAAPDVTTARHSYPILAKLATEHLDVALPMMSTLWRHPEFFVTKTKVGGEQYMDFTTEAIASLQTIKEQQMAERVRTVATGCPALVKMGKDGDKPSAIKQLLDWYCDVAEKVLS